MCNACSFAYVCAHRGGLNGEGRALAYLVAPAQGAQGDGETKERTSGREREREVAGRGYITRPAVLVPLSVLIGRAMYSNGASNMAAAPTSVVVMDRGNNTTCTINLHGLSPVSYRIRTSRRFASPSHQSALGVATVFYKQRAMRRRWRYCRPVS